MKYQFGFIGCGNMGGALAQAVCGSIQPTSIALCDADTVKSTLLAQRLGAAAVDLKTLVVDSDFIFLGVKPHGMANLLSDLRPILQTKHSRTVLISMAAGISIEMIEHLLGDSMPIIRIMPNTPVAVGEGMILYTCNREVTATEQATFVSALSSAGKMDLLAEDKIDAASALSGCGPAFSYLFAEGLADGAVECGLPREKAALYAAQTLLGAAKMLLESGQHPGALKDAVCSPGGTTIAGVHALEHAAFRSSAMDAVTTAYEKTLQMKTAR